MRIVGLVVGFANVADDQEIVEFASVAVEAELADEETEVWASWYRVDLVMRLPVLQVSTDFDCSAAVDTACFDRCVAAVGDLFSDLCQVREGFQAGHLEAGTVDGGGG